MGIRLSRRGLLAAIGLAPAACANLPRGAALSSARPPAPFPFEHGVASGDPEPDRVILWTHLGQIGSNPVISAQWEVSEDQFFTRLHSRGETEARAEADYTVKVDAGGLSPGTVYYYRFSAGGHVSPTGRTRTLPVGETGAFRLAAVSCANFSLGHFNVYDHLARRSDIELVIHLGDYLYETAPGGFDGGPAELSGRRHDPPHEAVTLADYRRRHAQYKRDGALQALHAAHPVVASWDDHEVANNAARDGAPGFAGSAADWQARREAALRAYHEWMPVRAPGGGAPLERRFRTLKLGQLATLAVLETRLSARARSLGFEDIAAYADDPGTLRAKLDDPGREMLGQAQREQLGAAFAGAGDGWMILANQTLMAPVRTPDIFPYLTPESEAELRARWDGAEGFLTAARHGLPLMMDAWDGYPAERETLFAAARAAGLEGGLLVLTGDTHAWWANELASADGTPAGVELATSSVTAPSPFSPELVGARGRDLALLVNRENRAVRYVNGQTHGYLELTLTPQAARARYMAVDTVKAAGYRVFEQARFSVTRGPGGQLKLGRPGGLGLKERFLF